MNEVKQFEDKFKIVYGKNSDNYGNGPFNTNKAISMCSGDIIKVMFQDDFFYDDEALEKIYGELESSDKFWLVNASNHTNNDGNSFYWDLYPQWNADIINGRKSPPKEDISDTKKMIKDIDPLSNIYLLTLAVGMLYILYKLIY